MIDPRAVRREFLGVLGFEDVRKFSVLYGDGSNCSCGWNGVDGRLELRGIHDAI
jgi:hypothetical protein